MSDQKLLTDGTLIIPTDVDVKDVYRVILDQKGTKFCNIFYRDAGEIIYCDSCKHWYSDADCGMVCEFTNMSQPEDGFCNWAERRGEQDDSV